MSKILNLNHFVKWILVFYLMALTFLSWNPWILPDSKQAVDFITWDLIDHAAAYGGLSLLMMATLTFKNRTLKMTFIVVFISGLLGIFFECGQYLFTSNRQFSFYDAIANVFGTVFGVLIFWIVYFSGNFFNKVRWVFKL